ncbi:SDR family NAD(P)-dependent oxidoreductase [Sphingomonas sp. C3-2]|uniref:SDR family NAD(P)-dependent oxidoreductase n=1 Tax=Sphingomonas sp. C3-2 TaxID=3062169 RepID=UPI00294AC8BE|nr:SDR family oxidoreductase [Sphingomonas sp. C3-2]WOK35106.1 SDR family oxidoreductase [Sphingomonas sp. C3-2]
MRTISELSDLTGRMAIITGGAGHIGRAMATALAEHHCNILLVDRDPDALVRAANELSDIGTGRIHTATVDLESEAQRLSLVNRVQADFGRLDILINNAGFVGDSQLEGWAVPFDQQRIDTWRRAVEVNLTAPFHLSQALSPLLRAGGKGSIINLGSIYGVLGPDLGLYAGTTMGNPGAYAASKGGLLQLTRWLSTSLAPSIRVNSISPGGLARGQDERFTARYLARTPLGRMGGEEDFKGVALFLASDLSAWITGQNILVDGGWSAW